MPMSDPDDAASRVTVGAVVAVGTLIGKRSHAPGLDVEVPCARGGSGTPWMEGTALEPRERNTPPVSD
jgi:hypothetical protein